MDFIKPLAATLGGGAMATGAYLTRDSWMPSEKPKVQAKKSVSQALTETKYKPLDITKEAGWTEVLAKYNEVHSSATKDTSQLKGECKALLEKEEFIGSDYQRARRWCVEIQSIGDRLKLFGKVALSTDASVNTDNEKWKAKIEEHKKDHPNKLNHNFGAEENQNLTDIKSKCKELEGKKSTDESFESDFSKSVEWCAQ